MIGLIALLVIALPVAWLVSEFKGSQSVRRVLGILALLSSFGVAWLAGSLSRFNYNAWYGTATDELIGTIIEELDAGHVDTVKRELKVLQEEYHPTYENRAGYDELVEQFVERVQHSR